MSKKFKDIFKNGSFKHAWIWCDLEGEGPQWELAIPFYAELGIFRYIKECQIDFVGIGNERAEDYLDCPAQEVVKPMPPEDID